MLELAKERLIEITQAESFAPIYVRLASTRVTRKAVTEPPDRTLSPRLTPSLNAIIARSLFGSTGLISRW